MNGRSDSKTYRFLMISTLTHVALAAGVMAIKIQSEWKKKQETQVEVLATEGATPAPAPEKESLETPTSPVTESEAPKKAEVAKAAEAPKASVAKELPAKSEPTVTPPAPVVVQKAAAKPVAVAQRPTSALPQKTVSETPTQDESPVTLPVAEKTELQEETPEEPTPTLKEEDIAEDLEKVDQEETAKVAAVHKVLSQQADEEMKKQEAQLAALKKKNQEDSDRMAQEQEARREREREALSAAAAERMAREAQEAREAEKAQQAEAAKLAEEARMAEKAKADSIVAGQGNGSAENGNGGSNKGAGAGGEPGEGDIRALSEMRQLPGNKRPLYEPEDRLKRRQGEVSFLAYVTKEGAVSNFKLVQSSGHRELDAKTLKALKTWKFYPGQEGWVEIPFKWDLQGGPQEMPTTLRRRAQVSQSQNN